MSPFFWATYILLWVLVAVLVITVLLLYRQFGLVYMNSRRRLDMQGPDVGRRAPTVDVVTVPAREPMRASWRMPQEGLGQFILFALPTCQVCKGLLPELAQLPDRWSDVEFVWLHGSSTASDAIDSAPSLPAWSVLAGDGMAAHQAFDVGTVPFAFVLEADGRVKSKGLINAVQDIERLISEAGVSSVRTVKSERR
jgi:methylamine dehydrogenase accessory protein MauD